MKDRFKQLSIILSLLTVFISSVSKAEWKQGTVTEIEAGSDNGYIYIDGLPLSTIWNCSSSKIRIQSKTDEVLDLVIAALISDRPLACDIIGCSGSYQSATKCLLKNQ